MKPRRARCRARLALEVRVWVIRARKDVGQQWGGGGGGGGGCRGQTACDAVSYRNSRWWLRSQLRTPLAQSFRLTRQHEPAGRFGAHGDAWLNGVKVLVRGGLWGQG